MHEVLVTTRDTSQPLTSHIRELRSCLNSENPHVAETSLSNQTATTNLPYGLMLSLPDRRFEFISIHTVLLPPALPLPPLPDALPAAEGGRYPFQPCSITAALLCTTQFPLKGLCLKTCQCYVQARACQYLAIHIPSDPAMQLLSADLLAAGAPAVVACIAGGLDHALQRIVIPVRRVGVLGHLNLHEHMAMV